jgi:hypothetical protein
MGSSGKFLMKRTIGKKCKILNFVFPKPLPPANHEIHFADELLISDDKVRDQLTTD